MNTALSELTGVRDSVAHYEDRGRGLGKRGKPVTLKPVDRPNVKLPNGGVLLLECLNSDTHRLGNTLADGTYGEVEITPATLEHARTAIQACLNAYTWSGHPSHWPG